MRILPTFAALALSAAAPLFAQQTVTCAANGPQRQYCQADTHDGVLLAHDHSHGGCRYGDTWGFNDHAIFVSGNCNADFLVTDHHGPYGGDNQQGNNYGNNGQQQPYPNGQQGGYGNPGGPPPYDPGQDHEGPHHLTIPAGTTLQVSLNQGVSANNVHPGDIIPATLTTDLVVNGVRIAHAGTPVSAVVTNIRPDRPDPLTVQLQGFTTHRESYTFQTTSIHSGREAVNAQGGGGGLGAALGNLIDGNRAADLPPGSIYNFQLTSPSRPQPVQ